MPARIRVRNLGKQFRKYHKDRPATFQEAIVRGLRKISAYDHFWALRDVNFFVPSGLGLGVVGPNGSGKSTLLRLIAGISRPDEGRVEVKGRIGGLLELGAGFHPDLTGRENIYINGIVSGLTRWEVKQRLDLIVAFAELEDAIDDPLRTYSTGMRMRLGFSVAAYTDPEVLLVDEVLAVGDVAFQKKCFERIMQFKKNGCAFVIVSHDTQKIIDFCDEVIWIKKGQVIAQGDPESVVNAYLADMQGRKDLIKFAPNQKLEVIKPSEIG